MTREPAVTLALALEHGLSAPEYRALLDHLGRTPSLTELGMVAAMWSEHCSYKSSRVHLASLPTEGPCVITGPGENAGVVDIGDGQVVVFKMESHNHPSFIEPYQGAATGVGGICRDVFTMGARPVALADCLRFGEASASRTPHLVSGVTAGIGGYGNALGIPTIAGDLACDRSYNGNNLVNVLCLGVARRDRIISGRAEGPGNSVIYVGARTGRDGIHGATMASAGFDDDTASRRPTVQVGDPFMEKLLLEACMEVAALESLVGMQDMGAAGLTSCAVEMAARAGTGMDIELERVPVREDQLTPYQIMLSESQERMLLVVQAGREAEIFEIFERWDLNVARIGQVTDTGRVVVRMDERVCADLDADFLADGPGYERPYRRPAYLDELEGLQPDLELGAALPDDPVARGEHARDALLALLAVPSITSKEWVYSQYDYNVGHGTVIRPGVADAGMVRVGPASAPDGVEPLAGQDLGRESYKGVTLSAGCNSRHAYLAPARGAALAVAEAYANLVAVGARPLAVSNCLNFGNPENPEVMWQFVECVRGLGDACRALGTPVVSGNVSLYNETDGQAIQPTPMVAMVGLVADARDHLTMGFRACEHAIAVVGDLHGDIAGSEYLATIHGRVAGIPAAFEPRRHGRVFDAMQALHDDRLLASAHDISDGGLAVAAIECALLAATAMDVRIDIPTEEARVEQILFGEAPARFLVSLSGEHLERAAALAREAGAPFLVIGATAPPVDGSEPGVSITVAGCTLALQLSRARQVYESSFAGLVGASRPAAPSRPSSFS